MKSNECFLERHWVELHDLNQNDSILVVVLHPMVIQFALLFVGVGIYSLSTVYFFKRCDVMVYHWPDNDCKRVSRINDYFPKPLQVVCRKR